VPHGEVFFAYRRKHAQTRELLADAALFDSAPGAHCGAAAESTPDGTCRSRRLNI